MSGPAIGQWLRGLARERPLEPAILAGDGMTAWAELDAMADRVAARVAAHARVALVAASSVASVAALHASLRGAFSLLTISPRAARPEIERLVGKAGSSILLVDGDRSAELGENLRIEVVAVDDVGGSWSGAPASSAPASAVPGSAELLVPTSGTVGIPRLVRLTPANLEASAAAWSDVLPPATGWLLSLGLAHVAGIGIVVRAVRDGAPVVIPDDPEPAALLGAIDRASAGGILVSHLSLVAVQLGRLLDDLGDGPPPPSIRAALLGGGPIPPTLVSRALRAGWPVVPTYGMTETASGVTALSLGDVVDHPASAGRALPGVELRTGDRGELEVRGPMVFGGYAGDETATSGAIGPDGWFRTGDVAKFTDDGLVHIVDRLDDLIISGGENITPAEVEAALLEHPGVAEAGVVGIPDATWGRVPGAAVVPRIGTTLDEAELLTFARTRLASFKIPARIVLVEGLPRSSNGKLLRRELAPLLATGRTPVHLAVVDRPGPPSAPVVVVLHATLATAASLAGLAEVLAADARVLAIDRRGSGGTPLVPAEAVSIADHVADLLRALDDAEVREPAVIVGHSFGGVVGLELAARHPDRAAAVLAWEPPYLALADDRIRQRFAGLAAEIAEAHRSGGAPAAAARFYSAVNGAGSWDALPARLRASIGSAGDGALADAAMPDLDPEGLGRIAAPVVIATGGRGDPLYAPIADALVARIPAAHRVDLDGMGHMAPISDPQPIARLVRDLLTGLHSRSLRDDR